MSFAPHAEIGGSCRSLFGRPSNVPIVLKLTNDRDAFPDNTAYSALVRVRLALAVRAPSK